MKSNTEKVWGENFSKVGLAIPVGFFGLVGRVVFKDTQLPYDEERDNWSFQMVEPGRPVNSQSQAPRLESVAVISHQVPTFKQKRRVSWLKLFGLKA